MFRAYADPSGGDKEEGECDDDDRERYSSFDQAKILEARAKVGWLPSFARCITIPGYFIFSIAFIFRRRVSRRLNGLLKE